MFALPIKLKLRIISADLASLKSAEAQVRMSLRLFSSLKLKFAVGVNFKGGIVSVILDSIFQFYSISILIFYSELKGVYLLKNALNS